MCPSPTGSHINTLFFLLMTISAPKIENSGSKVGMVCNAPVNVYPQVGDRGQTRGFLTLKIFVVRIPCMSKVCTVRKSLYLSIYSIHFVRKPHPGEQGLCQTSLYGSKVVVRIPWYARGPPPPGFTLTGA